jgi:isoleucyl-tRNA synthetase
MDKISVSYQAEDKISGIFEKNRGIIQSEVLAADIVTVDLGGYKKEWNINGEKVSLEVKKQL